VKEVGFLQQNNVRHDRVAGEGGPTVRVEGDEAEEVGRGRGDFPVAGGDRAFTSEAEGGVEGGKPERPPPPHPSGRSNR
jgi:hypothetical protein